MSDKYLTAVPVVIPAKAGIQWFRPDMPTRKQAGMTIFSGGRRDNSKG